MMSSMLLTDSYLAEINRHQFTLLTTLR